MNTRKTQALVTRNGVVTIQADKTHSAPEIDKLLQELGNEAKGIPFVAIFPAGGGQPILLDGIITQKTVLKALQDAGPSQNENKQTAWVR